MPVEFFPVLERYDRGVERQAEVFDAADYVGIARNDRTVVTVDRLFVLLFVQHVRHQYAVDLFLDQVVDVGMHQLCGKADVVGHDLADVTFVGPHVRGVGQHDLYATLRQKGVPEGILLE